jgi:hypothetical protein
MDELVRHDADVIAAKIITLRGKKVMLDKDLAPLYGVTTGNLNKAVQRNIERFPDDFMFQLSEEEFQGLRFQIGIPKKGGTRYMPYAFTEQGVSMLSAVLNSSVAIDISIRIMRAFVKLRSILAENDALRYAIEGLERRVGKNERDIQLAIKAIQSLLTPHKPPTKKQRMGFGPPDKAN